MVIGSSRLSRVLPRRFFARPVLDVARDLLGCVVEHQTEEGRVGVRLSEVEAYAGGEDPASHAFRGRTARNATMFGPPGHAYVYFTYGMHFCMNLVCGPSGIAQAVLLRAGEVVEGTELARLRRRVSSDRDLARGPARLTMALGIAREHDGLDVTRASSPLRVRAGATVADEQVRTGPRTGVVSAPDVPWRFYVAGDPTVSAYRPWAPRRRNR